MLGAQELEGVDIYDMLHCRDGSYLLATDQGLIRFDGYRFKDIACPDMLMSSIFDLVEDTLGNVFYHNLSGQIFRYRNGDCQLFIALPDSLVSADMHLGIDDRNRLVITSNRLMVADDKGRLRPLTQRAYFGALEKHPDGSLTVCSSKEYAIYRLRNGKLTRSHYVHRPEEWNNVPGMIHFGQRSYLYYSNTCRISGYDKSGSEHVFDPSAVVGQQHIFKLYVTSTALWFASSSLGVLRADLRSANDTKGQFLFPRTLISNVTEDREGNVLLGTFGKGIIVISNERTEDLNFNAVEEDVISVTATKDGTLYFGTQSGKLLQRSAAGTLTTYRQAQLKSMEALFAIGPRSLLIGEATGLIIDTDSRREVKLDVGSVKDKAMVDATTVLVASNVGAYRTDLNSGAVEQVGGLTMRHYSIGYDPTTASIYSGTSKGLLIRTKNGNIGPVKLQGKDIIVRDFLVKDGRVYAATDQNGVLVFKDDRLADQWNMNSGLASDRTTQLLGFRNKLLVATLNGIQMVDADGNVLRTIDQADGLNSARVIDMELMGTELWVVHSAGVQKVMLDQLGIDSFRPSIRLRTVLVNDSLVVPLTQHDFKASEQKFSFELSSISLRHRHGIGYRYRLEGAESAWRSADYADNIIEYRSLSPGTYTFRAKAVYRSMESEEVTYTFTIATPFYKAWWFYLVILISVVLALAFWFRRRLKRQQLLAEQQNELNASKLTAIRSQMNPHFIFNALNSIQSLVLKGDVDNSYTYITKFANLVRRTLNYSDKEFIDFSEEMKLIELYLTLEQLRFKEDFEFTINMNGIEDVMIPPMLIQPFIENALLHGLLHRSGPKRIRLDFELTDVLTCTITDNGVGRAKAKAIKERQRSEHESFSVNAISSRFEILERYYEGKLGFDYEDLMENGEATGTRVTLRIPVKHKF